MTKTVFCDESGFDGNNLWHPDQPHFVYSAVDIAESDAADLVKEARDRFKLSATELHAMQLLRKPKSEQAVRWILDQMGDRFRVACFHKRFALAGKMFEYFFEPIVSDASNYFYANGFHKFVANGIFCAALGGPDEAESALVDFQQLMRDRDSSSLSRVLERIASIEEGQEGFLQTLSTILICNQPAIQSELSMFEGNGRNEGPVRWILELTNTALRSLLAELSGPEMEPLIVTCDDSKPLREDTSFINAMVGRTDYHEVRFEDRTCQLTFNLKEPIHFGDSKNVAGIQLADIAATSATYALKHRDESFTKYWFDTHLSAVCEGVFPDPEEFDLAKPHVVKNTFILQALADRSVKKQSLIANLRELDALTSAATNEFMGIS